MTRLDRWIDERAGRAELWLRTCSTRERIALDLIGAATVALVVTLASYAAGLQLR